MPIVVSLSEINRETECIVVRPRQVREEGHTNQVPCLTFFFQRKSAAEVDAMAEDLVPGHRLVRIEDGTNLIAECKIVGRAMYQQTGGSTLHGLILAFEWLGDAERAATAMREDWETYLRRKLDQRGSWYDHDPKLRR